MSKIINHIGLSSGKDSTAAWAWIINESGYSKESIVGTTSDTENEYPEYYKQIQALSDYGVKHGVRPVRILRSIGFLELVLWKRRFPSARARFCTEILKMLPLKHFIEEMWLGGYEVITHSGVRADESTERSMMPPEDFDGYLKCVVRRPMLKKTLADVWAMHRKYGIPINPLYFKGKKRVGCRLCCMSQKADIRSTAKHFPEVIAEYSKWEQRVTKERSRGVATFFPSDRVPKQYHSIQGLVRKRDSARGKKGETYSACTIKDVVEWSKTLDGGKEIGFDFMYEEDDSHLPCQSGYCE